MKQPHLINYSPKKKERKKEKAYTALQLAISTDGLLLLVIIILLRLFNDDGFYCSSECEQLITSVSFGMEYLIWGFHNRVRSGLPASLWEFRDGPETRFIVSLHDVSSHQFFRASPSRFKSRRRRLLHL